MKASTTLFWFSIFIGVLFRIGLSALGSNYDLESFWIVSDLVVSGKSVYAETTRYNYGPIWFWILGSFRWVCIALHINTLSYFHLLAAGFLTAIDAITALMLRDAYGKRASLFFFLNPVSILITGHHSQFDNLAILLAFAACSGLTLDQHNPTLRKQILLMCLLGLSLSLKHICAFFPLWLWWAYRDASTGTRLLAVIVPYGVFALLLLPFAFDPVEFAGITKNVLRYGGVFTGGGLMEHLLNLFIDFGRIEIHSRLSFLNALFIMAAILSGFYWAQSVEKKIPNHELLLIYLVSLVAFANVTADQYLAIPLIALARYYRQVAVWGYSLAATAILLTSNDGVFAGRLVDITFIQFYNAQIWLLILLLFHVRRLYPKGEGPQIVVAHP